MFMIREDAYGLMDTSVLLILFGIGIMLKISNLSRLTNGKVKVKVFSANVIFLPPLYIARYMGRSKEFTTEFWLRWL